MTTTVDKPQTVEEVKKKMLNLVSKNWSVFNKAFAVWDKKAKIDNTNSQQVIMIIKTNFPDFRDKEDEKVLMLGYHSWRSYIKNIMSMYK